jgi:type I restriction enzyme S subunit
MIPEGWTEVRVDKLFDVKSSKRVLQSDWRSSGVPFYRGREITELSARGTVDNELFIERSLFESLRSRYSAPKRGDILVSAIGTIGNAYLVKGDHEFYFKDASVLWLSERGAVNSSFILHWMRSPGFVSQLPTGNGTTVDTLTIGVLAGLQVLLPPIDEQRAIADALSDADALVESLDALIAKKRDMMQAAMQQLLTGRTRLPGFTDMWEETSIGAHTEISKGKGLSREAVAKSGLYPCLLYGELFTQYGRVARAVVSRTSIDDGVLSEQGDVLMPGSTTTSGADLATATALLLDGVRLGGDINVIRPNLKRVDPRFLAYLINAGLRAEVSKRAQGITIHHLYGKEIAEIEVRMPSLHEQRVIADAFEDLDAEIDALVVQREKADLVKQGMMQELLSGRVRLV